MSNHQEDRVDEKDKKTSEAIQIRLDRSGDEIRERVNVEVYMPNVEPPVVKNNKKEKLGGDAKKYFRDQTSKKQKKKVLKTKNVQLKKNLKQTEQMFRDAAFSAAEAEILFQEDEPGYIETEGEKTWRLSQKDIKDAVDIQTANKIFQLKLDSLGPYSFDYTRNGR